MKTRTFFSLKCKNPNTHICKMTDYKNKSGEGRGPAKLMNITGDLVDLHFLGNEPYVSLDDFFAIISQNTLEKVSNYHLKCRKEKGGYFVSARDAIKLMIDLFFEPLALHKRKDIEFSLDECNADIEHYHIQVIIFFEKHVLWAAKESRKEKVHKAAFVAEYIIYSIKSAREVILNNNINFYYKTSDNYRIQPLSIWLYKGLIDEIANNVEMRERIQCLIMTGRCEKVYYQQKEKASRLAEANLLADLETEETMKKKKLQKKTRNKKKVSDSLGPVCFWNNFKVLHEEEKHIVSALPPLQCQKLEEYMRLRLAACVDYYPDL